MKKIYVTGTGTDVGKTYVASLILDAWVREGRDAIGFKPICCGDRADTYTLQAASEPTPDLDLINPVWLKVPLAPLAAAMMAGEEVDLAKIRGAYAELPEGDVLVEGAGGWEVPIQKEYGFPDLAVELGLPVLVVADNQLGCLNHILLTVKAIQAAGLEPLGIVLNHVDEERDAASISNRAVLEAVSDVPVILEIMHGETEIELPPELL